MFVHVTVPPTFRCTVAGENAKFTILTEAAITGVFPDDVGFVELFELLLPPQPASKKRPKAITRAKEMILVFIKMCFLYYHVQSSRVHTKKGCLGVKELHF